MSKIAHLNCHLFAKTVPAFFKRDLLLQDRARLTRICEWARSCGADIVILSEVWSDAIKSRIEDALKPDFAHFLRFDAPKGLKLGPEFLVASKIPMHDARWIAFDDLASWDRFSTRLACGFHAGGTFLCASHFDSTSAEDRTQNLRETLDFVHRESRGRPAIITGDLNIAELRTNRYDGAPFQPRELSDEYIAMRDMMAQRGGFTDAWHTMSLRDTRPEALLQEEPPAGLTFDTSANWVAHHFYPSPSEPRVRIDYFWTRGNVVRAMDVPRFTLSDHFPIVLTVDQI